MASETITGFSTVSGVAKYDYNALENKPVLLKKDLGIENAQVNQFLVVSAVSQGKPTAWKTIALNNAEGRSF